MEREPADGCDFNDSNNKRTNGDGIETSSIPTTEFNEYNNIIDNNNNNINDIDDGIGIDDIIEDDDDETSEQQSQQQDDGISYLRCSSIQTEELQRRQRRLSHQRQSSPGYPGLAFNSPMYSNTILRFGIIANEIRDLKQNQLKKAESEVSQLNRRIQMIEDNLEKNEERLRITLLKLEEAQQTADESERIRKTLETKTNMEDDRISFLEAQLVQARQIAEESDKKYEEYMKAMNIT